MTSRDCNFQLDLLHSYTSFFGRHLESIDNEIFAVLPFMMYSYMVCNLSCIGLHLNDHGFRWFTATLSPTGNLPDERILSTAMAQSTVQSRHNGQRNTRVQEWCKVLSAIVVQYNGIKQQEKVPLSSCDH